MEKPYGYGKINYPTITCLPMILEPRKNYGKKHLAKYCCVFLLTSFLISINHQSQAAERIGFEFIAGSILKKQYFEGETIEKPILIIRGEPQDTKMVFPVGAGILWDKSDQGYLLVKFVDKRFAAFLTSGVDLIDLKRKAENSDYSWDGV